MRVYNALITLFLLATASIAYAGFVPGRRYCGYRLLDWGTLSPAPSTLHPHAPSPVSTCCQQCTDHPPGFPYEQLQAELRWWNKCDLPSGVNGALFRVYETYWGRMIVSLDDPCCMGCESQGMYTWGDSCAARAVNVTTCSSVCE